MRDSLVLTVVGPDRTGLVEALAHQISEAGGNWEASHMARHSLGRTSTRRRMRFGTR